MSAPATTASPSRALLEPAAVARLMRDRLPLDWVKTGGPREVRIERYWPTGRAGLTLEWSFCVASNGRHSLFAVPDTNADSDDLPPPDLAVSPPRVTRDGVRGLSVHIAENDLTVHSPDRDPAMPHLAACLDADTASRCIGVLGGGLEGDPETAAHSVEPELLGYRARRRAAIRYRARGSDSAERVVLGKTFRDARGARLLDVHAGLHEQLLTGSGGRVAVPGPVAYDRELRMVLLAWAPGKKLDDASVSPTECARAAVGALTYLHQVDLQGTPPFTVQDECNVIRRWHRVLETIDPAKAEDTASLVTGLLAWADTVGTSGACTIHRDFYERQLVMTPRTVTILDLDTVARGDPCVDLGNFLAHLLLHVQRRGRGESRFAPAADLFIRRYEARAGAVDRRALGFYVCSALFRLGAVHTFRTATGRFAATLWQLAARQLAQPSFTAAQWDSSRRHPMARRSVRAR